MPQDMPEKCEALEDLRWAPGLSDDNDLLMYLSAARSMAAFVSTCDGGSPKDGCFAASRDKTTIIAFDLLHEYNYDTGKALEAFVKYPVPKGTDKKWAEEEKKHFVKGIQKYGKNFFKIRKEMLPQKETADLVEFYYLWKNKAKPGSMDMTAAKAQRRHRRPNALRRSKALNTSSNNVSKTPINAVDNEDQGENIDDEQFPASPQMSVPSPKLTDDVPPPEKNEDKFETDIIKGSEKDSLADLVENDQTLDHNDQATESEGSPTPPLQSNTEEAQNRAEVKTPPPKSPPSPLGVTMVQLATNGGLNIPAVIPKEESSIADDDEKPVIKHPSPQPIDPQSRHTIQNSSSQLVSQSMSKDLWESESRDVDTKIKKSDSSLMSFACNPICPPLLTPKQEPPPSPPGVYPTEALASKPLNSESNSSDAWPRQPSSSPVRIKEEKAFNGTEPSPRSSPIEYNSSRSDAITFSRLSSNESRNLSSSQLHKPPNDIQLTHSPHRPRQSGGDVSNKRPSSKETIDPPPLKSSRETHSTPPTHRTSSNRPPSVISKDSGLMNSFNPSRLSAENAHSGQPSAFTLTTPVEQRLHGSSPFVPPSNPASSSLPNPAAFPYGASMLPPGVVHPYFPAPGPPPHWYALAARGMQPGPLGFPPHSVPSHHPIHSHSPLISSKPRSPVTSHANRVVGSPATQSIYSGLSHQPLSASSMYSSSSLKHDGRPGDGFRSHDMKHERTETHTIDDDEADHPPTVPFRGPSPEVKIDDSECHRSQNAIFLRHWNRGECNSCARTDLTFKPVPESITARKRDERARKAAEKEREEQKKLAAEKGLLGCHGPNEPNHLSPFDRHTPRSSNFSEASVLRHLSEYSRPHGSPGFPRGGGGGPMVGSGPSYPFGVPISESYMIDPLLPYHIASGLYGPAARQRLEQEEKEKRERIEIERREQIKEIEMKRLAALASGQQGHNMFDPHLFELQRRFAASLQSSGVPGHSTPGPPHSLGPFSIYNPSDRERLERSLLSQSNNPEALQAAADRIQAERLGLDQLSARFPMGLSPSELHSHAHAHTHAHTHLHLHDPNSAAAAAAAMGMSPLDPLLRSESSFNSSHPVLQQPGFPGQRGAIRPEFLHPGAAGLLGRPPFEDNNPCLINPLMQQLRQQRF